VARDTGSDHAQWASFVLSYQPMIGNADFPQDLYLARGADLVREPAADVTAAVRWVPSTRRPP